MSKLVCVLTHISVIHLRGFKDSALAMAASRCPSALERFLLEFLPQRSTSTMEDHLQVGHGFTEVLGKHKNDEQQMSNRKWEKVWMASEKQRRAKSFCLLTFLHLKKIISVCSFIGELC